VVEQSASARRALRTQEDSLITVPNSRFIASDIENLTLRAGGASSCGWA